MNGGPLLSSSLLGTLAGLGPGLRGLDPGPGLEDPPPGIAGTLGQTRPMSLHTVEQLSKEKGEKVTS